MEAERFGARSNSIIHVSMDAYIQKLRAHQTKHDNGIPHFQMKMCPFNRRQQLIGGEKNVT
jgi:hypothetical protein